MITEDVDTLICAKEVMETIPLLMDHIRSSVRKRTHSGSSLSHIRALAYLKRVPGATLSEVADFLGVSNPTTSAVVDRLVRRGFISRANDPDERRCIRLNLTPAGRKYYEEINQYAVKELGELLSELSDAKIRKIFEGLSLVKNCLSRKENNGK